MEQRNLLIAIVLSVGILIGFQFLLEHTRPPTPVPPPTTQTAGGQTAVPGTTPGTTPSPTATPGAPAPTTTAPETRAAAIADQPRIRINTTAPARLDRADRRPPRRPHPGELPRDGRPEEPRSGAAVADRHAGALSRGVRLGGGDAGSEAAGARHQVDRRGRAAHPGPAGDLDLGQRRRARLHPPRQHRRELHVHGARQRAQHRLLAGEAPTLRADQPGPAHPRSPAITSCTKA